MFFFAKKNQQTFAGAVACNATGICLLVCTAAPALSSTTCPTYLNGARLVQYGVFDGSPTHLADLRGEDGPHGNMWNLTDPAVNKAEGYQVQCTYLHGAKITLKLPATVKACRPTGSAFIRDVTCE